MLTGQPDAADFGSVRVGARAASLNAIPQVCGGYCLGSLEFRLNDLPVSVRYALAHWIPSLHWVLDPRFMLVVYVQKNVFPRHLADQVFVVHPISPSDTCISEVGQPISPDVMAARLPCAAHPVKLMTEIRSRINLRMALFAGELT